MRCDLPLLHDANFKQAYRPDLDKYEPWLSYPSPGHFSMVDEQYRPMLVQHSDIWWYSSPVQRLPECLHGYVVQPGCLVRIARIELEHFRIIFHSGQQSDPLFPEHSAERHDPHINNERVSK